MGIIALDGAAASGKGTIARHLCDHYGCGVIFTGLYYRYAALCCQDWGLDVHDEDLVCAQVSSLDFSGNCFDNDELKSSEIGSLASVISCYKGVRRSLQFHQRKAAHWQDRRYGRVIVEGRDVATRLFPDTPVKIYLSSDLSIRSFRRYKQFANQGKSVVYSHVFDALYVRDRRDSLREHDPLVRSPGSYFCDTSDKSLDEVFRDLISHIDAHLPSSR